jgi:hypothetical protein
MQGAIKPGYLWWSNRAFSCTARTGNRQSGLPRLREHFATKNAYYDAVCPFSIIRLFFVIAGFWPLFGMVFFQGAAAFRSI